MFLKLRDSQVKNMQNSSKGSEHSLLCLWAINIRWATNRSDLRDKNSEKIATKGLRKQCTVIKPISYQY